MMKDTESDDELLTERIIPVSKIMVEDDRSRASRRREEGEKVRTVG